MQNSLLGALFSDLQYHFKYSMLSNYIDFYALGWVLFIFTLLIYLISKDQWLRLRMELQQNAMYDLLTGLPNRRLFEDRMMQKVRLCGRKKESFALILGDLNNFKLVNDTLGHHAGDDLLKQVAMELSTVVRSSDTVARLGGDEFAFIINDVRTPSDVQQVAEKILLALAQPIMMEGKAFQVGISLGISFYPEHGTNQQELLRRADIALYQAKKSPEDKISYFQTEPLSIEVVNLSQNKVQRLA
jgi:diguanylate cyclase (GGDEF)-like protein